MEKKTLSKIDSIVSRINTHPEYSACVSKHFVAHMRQESYSHSSSIELESDEPKGRRDIESLKRSYIENLEKGRDYLAKEGISVYTIDGLVRVVEPNANSKGFRKEAIKFGSYYGVEPEKVPQEVDNLVAKINNDSSLHAVDRAALAHLEMIRIHPYSDGNGRSARLLQNFCLEQRGYPPVIIDSGERGLYMGILNAVWPELMSNKENNQNSYRAQNIFYEFIESKVLESAERLESELKSKRLYDVNFRHVKDLETVRVIANALKASEGKKGHPTLANHIKRKGKTAFLTVQGNLSIQELKEFLVPFGKKYKLDYSVTPRTQCWDN